MVAVYESLNKKPISLVYMGFGATEVSNRLSRIGLFFNVLKKWTVNEIWASFQILHNLPNLIFKLKNFYFYPTYPKFRHQQNFLIPIFNWSLSRWIIEFNLKKLLSYSSLSLRPGELTRMVGALFSQTFSLFWKNY